MDAATPLVSVIMSVHNGEQWLKEAIESINHQTWTNHEFIIIDDASNEATKKILGQYSSIKIVRRETQQGLTKNLNTAIDLCKGEYIARMDADDISLATRLEKQVSYLQLHPDVDVVGTFITLIDENGQPKGEWPDDRKAPDHATIKAILPSANVIAHPTVMIRASVLKQYRYNEDHTHSQDWDLWLRLVNDGKVIEKINEPLLLYRVHDLSITKQSNKKSAFLKKHEFYQRYLKTNRSGDMTAKVKRNYLFNRIKLFLSSIKRNLTS